MRAMKPAEREALEDVGKDLMHVIRKLLTIHVKLQQQEMGETAHNLWRIANHINDACEGIEVMTGRKL